MSIHNEEFHQLAMDYRGASVADSEAAYERLYAYIDKHYPVAAQPSEAAQPANDSDPWMDNLQTEQLRMWRDLGVSGPKNELQSIQAWLSCLGQNGEKKTGEIMRKRMLLLMTAAEKLHGAGPEAEYRARIYDERPEDRPTDRTIAAPTAAASAAPSGEVEEGEEIDTPGFMDMMNTFMQESSSEEFNEAAYNAARAALVQHIRQLGNVQYIRGYDKRKSEEVAPSAPKAAMTDGEIADIYRGTFNYTDDISVPAGTLRLAKAIEAASGPNLALVEALKEMLDMYISTSVQGETGNWDCEKEPEVIKARAAMAAAGVSLEAK